MNDIEILEDMRDNIYGAMQFEDDYQVNELEEKQFNALNLAIKSINRVKELEEIEQEHKKQNGKLQEKIKELEEKEDLVKYCRGLLPKDTIAIMMCNDDFCRNFGNDFISKDKIKAKIKELEKDEEFYREQDRIYEFEGKINILQELLEE